MNRQPLLLILQDTVLLVEAMVACVQDQVDADHNEVETVEHQYVPLGSEVGHIGFVDQLGCNTGDVPEEDKEQEGQTLALGRTCFVRFHHVQRPRSTEAYYHNNFQNFTQLLHPLERFFCSIAKFFYIVNNEIAYITIP